MGFLKPASFLPCVSTNTTIRAYHLTDLVKGHYGQINARVGAGMYKYGVKGNCGVNIGNSTLVI